MARKAAGEMDESGFTLIELLIVIVVLGILAGVVIFALGGVTTQSAVAACKSDGATVSTALAAFNTDNPGKSATVIEADLWNTTTEGTDGIVGGPFLQSWPTSSHYVYSLSGGALQLAPVLAGGTDATAIAAPYTSPVVCEAIKG
jgi:general secretion pathway protein G